MRNSSQIDHKRIYKDIIDLKYPHKKSRCEDLLSKKSLSSLDIIELNKRIFGTAQVGYNQKHRSYGQSDVVKIIDYQRKYKLNNSQLANHFNLSRNTVAKWKKLFVL